jgi:hypothetical protein
MSEPQPNQNPNFRRKIALKQKGNPQFSLAMAGIHDTTITVSNYLRNTAIYTSTNEKKKTLNSGAF